MARFLLFLDLESFGKKASPRTDQPQAARLRSVAVITLDSESNNPGSNPGATYPFLHFFQKINKVIGNYSGNFLPQIRPGSARI